MSLMVGTAGEHFVCFDCFYQGYSANIVNGQLRYDVLITKKGYFYKVQVKTSTTTTTEGKSYQYVLKYTKNQALKGGYNKKDVDIFAFVNPVLRKVAYIPHEKVSNNWKVTIQKSDYDLLTLQSALDYLKTTF